jgi:hypothetical protein
MSLPCRNESSRAIAQEWRILRAEKSTAKSRKPSGHCESRRLNVEEVLALYWKFAKTYYVLRSDPQEERISAVLIYKLVDEAGQFLLPASPKAACLPGESNLLSAGSSDDR